MMRRSMLHGACCLLVATASSQTNAADPLSYHFDGKYGQVEVGGHYAGIEFHRSRPLPSRISFYYPVANSIDLSTDYWRRDESLPMAVAVQVNKRAKRWIGKEPWNYTLSPHKVMFERDEDGIRYSMSYEFCLNEPALVFSLKMKNISSQPASIAAYTHLMLALRTCQTYARKDPARTLYDSSYHAVIAQFDDPETQHAVCFVQNVAAAPSQWTTSGDEVAATDSGTSNWTQSGGALQGKTFTSVRRGISVAGFVYERTLQPYDSLEIIQLIGSTRRTDVYETLGRLKSSWKTEVSAYDSLVRRKAQADALFSTGDVWLDRSATWARAILATNAHYINGSVVPMPCPAEYNFFFTHDVLMTDLAALNFDLPRVKKDLLYIASHAKDGIIPHAYYWRDDGFKTEYCTPDNWNHLWFVLVSAGYLRHSMDDSTARVLYPLVTKSLEEILVQKKTDNLMYAFRPDWWDIGHVEGPRSYITILTIRALREYVYLGSVLGQNAARLLSYSRIADSMQTALQSILWDEQARYLLNGNGGLKDTHYYMGSLLAPVFGVLGDRQSKELVATATEKLLDPRIGVRCVAPADFHTAEAIAFFKFAGDEAGQPYYYINGGVWPHNNAWYALALQHVGQENDAVEFARRTMTLDGIARSPMGIPAMYEYRYANPESKEFGKIDKPSFLWAGGFYLYTLYQLFGVKENEWNVAVAGPLPSSFENASYSFAFGMQKRVTVSGKGKYLQSCLIDAKSVPSLVLPLNARNSVNTDVKFGTPAAPYLARINAVLHSADFNESKQRLSLRLSSFSGHHVVATVVAPGRPKHASLDGKTLTSIESGSLSDGICEVMLTFNCSNGIQTLQIDF